MNHSWRFMDIRVQRIGDANNNMNRIINANIRCGRISNPTERTEYGIGLNEVKSYEIDEDFFNSLEEESI